MEVGKVRLREEWESSTGDADGDKQDSSESGGEKGDSSESGCEKGDSSESGGEKRDSSESDGDKAYKIASYAYFEELSESLPPVNFDGSEDDDDELYNDGLRKLTDEEYKKYCHQVCDSDGFDIDPLPPCIFTLGLIVPDVTLTDFHYKKAEFAIQRQNEEGKNLKLIKIIKCNDEVACPMNYYLTLEAEDLDTGRSDIYQVKVVQRLPNEKSYVSVFKLRESLASASE